MLRPAERYLALPGFVYGGLIASLVDCHGIGTAAAAAMLADGLRPGQDESPRFVTASLTVDYLKPTPAGAELVARARPVEVKGRKVVVEVSVLVSGTETAKGRVVAVRVPDSMVGKA